MEINRVNVRTWSMLGERRTFGLALDSYAEEMDRLFVMSGDLLSSSGLDRFVRNYPEKFLSAGIEEQNMVGIASGMAADGYKVFVSSFSPFITGRAYDQIRMHLGYMHHDVKLVGLAAGIGVGIQGNSHYGLDDVALMRAIPGMMIVSPSDGAEVVKAVKALYDYDGPAYLRLVGEQGCPIVNKEDYGFQLGKAITLRDGEDVTIFSAGTMVYQSLQAAKLLEEANISVKVVNMHTIKPIDVEAIRASYGSKLLVAIEEGSVVGGLGSAVAETVAMDEEAPRLMIMGVPDCFPKAASYKHMLDVLGLDAAHIAEKIKQSVLK
ncbi:MAG: transketolase [Paludibacteraceae bacterium]|nr:transketolase [Paludibacteraceae bacterium]